MRRLQNAKTGFRRYDLENGRVGSIRKLSGKRDEVHWLRKHGDGHFLQEMRVDNPICGYLGQPLFIFDICISKEDVFFG